MIDRDKIVEDLGNVYEFLKEIHDPGADSVAIAAGLISGDLDARPGARLLTLGEVREWKEFLWIESRNPARQLVQGIFFKWEDGSLVFLTRDDLWIHKFSAIYYGMFARCWATRPTEEEMAAVPWEEQEEVSGDGH